MNERTSKRIGWRGQALRRRDHAAPESPRPFGRAARVGLLAVIFGGVVLVPHLAGLEARQGLPGTDDDYYKELELFEHALAIVRSDYVEEPEAQPLIYGAIKGMLATLDPHSQFLDPDSYNELKVDTEGEFGGLGIEITIKDELLTIISPIDGTPAHQAGLAAGDRIVKIDGELTRGITLLEAVKKLRGRPGTQVELVVLREGDNELKEFAITRDIIKIDSIPAARMVGDRIGYIRISDFRENTPDDLRSAIEELRKTEMDSLVLDLRNNPGGLLDVSRSVAEFFLKRNQLIVSTRGRLRNQNLELRARSTGPLNAIPLVVLINQGSASASEIVAGALQDHHRAVIMGMKSHGKASVQTIFPLKDGSALRLTTSKYFTPDGRSIHGEGIHPDVEVPFEPPPKDEERSEAEALFTRMENGPEDGNDQEEQDKDDPLRRDNQLARAVDLLKGLRVYQHMETATP
ncbi:MAG TPA: S41 family peptidase [bacterium]